MMKPAALSVLIVSLVLGYSLLVTECQGYSFNSLANSLDYSTQDQQQEIDLDDASHDAGDLTVVGPAKSSLSKRSYQIRELEPSFNAVYPTINFPVTSGRTPFSFKTPRLLPSAEEHLDEVRAYSNSTNRDDFPCPMAASIVPCQCWVDGANIDLNCTLVESEEQLASVFQQEFPVQALHALYMSQNDAVRALRNILNGVTFEQVDLSPGPFVLEEISDYFLLNMRQTLTLFQVMNSQLNSDFFPFHVIPDLEKLNHLHIHANTFTWVPKLFSSSLNVLYFDFGDIASIEPGTFTDLQNLRQLGLYGNAFRELKAGTMPIREISTEVHLFSNRIESIEPGTFVHENESSLLSNQPMLIRLDFNQLQSLQAGTFPLRDGNMTIWLQYNKIASIEPGTFVMPQTVDSFSLTLWLFNNNLTTVDEAVFGSLLPYTTQFLLHDNPLECHCDVAWLVLDANNMAKVDPEATCISGTRLHDLDPVYFQDFCWRSRQ